MLGSVNFPIAKPFYRREMQRRVNTFTVFSVLFLVIGAAGLAIVCGMYYATYLSTYEVS